jgi:hypothetical protein
MDSDGTVAFIPVHHCSSPANTKLGLSMPFEHRYITSPRIKPVRRFSAIAGDLVFWRPGWNEENDLAARAGILYGELTTLVWSSFLGGLAVAVLVGHLVRPWRTTPVVAAVVLIAFFGARFIIAHSMWSRYKRKEWNQIKPH